MQYEGYEITKGLFGYSATKHKDGILVKLLFVSGGINKMQDKIDSINHENQQNDKQTLPCRPTRSAIKRAP